MIFALYYRGITLPERGGETERPTPLELDIMRSFGWAIVETEDALYQRYLNISASRSLMLQEEFRSHLKALEAKGFLAPIDFHGKRAYRRLLISSDVGKDVLPKEPLDEMRLILGSRKVKPKPIAGTTRITSDLIRESENVGNEIQKALERWLLKEVGRISKGMLHAHMVNMEAALKESEEALFEYVRTEVPGILAEVGMALRTYGQEFLLLTLKLTEANVKKYSF